jgi:competence protein ComEC
MMHFERRGSAVNQDLRAWAGPVVWVGVMLGLLMQLQQARLWPASVYILLMLAGALLSLWGWRHPARLRGVAARGLVLLLAAALFMAGMTGLRGCLRAEQRLVPALEGQDLDIVAVIEAMPQWQLAGWRMEVRTQEARDLQGRLVDVPDRIALAWYDRSARYEPLAWAQSQAGVPAVQAGERWRWRVRLKAPQGNFNPGGFDFELWMWERGVGASGYVRSGLRDPVPRLLGQTGHHPVQWLRQRVRDALLTPTADPLQTRAVLAALVTGDQTVIDSARWEVFRATGVSHLMSISGLHITMLAWVMAWLVRALWRLVAGWGSNAPLWVSAPTAAGLAGLTLASAYAVFSGWGVPAQRTVCMLGVVTLLQISGLRWPWYWTLASAALAVVLMDPWSVLQVGFWLSFVAVGALLLSSRLRTTAVPEGLPMVRGAMLGRVAVALWGLLREQAVVTAVLTPLGVLFFGQLSLVGLLANLLAIPWITLLITPLALLGMLVPGLWTLTSVLLQPLLYLLDAMAAWPWARLYTARPPLWLALPAVLGGLWLIWPAAARLRWFGLALLWPALWWQAPRPVPGAFEVWMADVGQGTAVLVRTAHHTLLYDSGPRYSPEADAGHRVLMPLLQSLGDRLDAVVLSHSDTDHIGGAVSVQALAKPGRWWSSMPQEHPLWTELERVHAVERHACQAGQAWQWDGVRFEFLHPGGPARTNSTPNSQSCVLRLKGTEAAALLTGDIEAAQENALIVQGLEPVDLLLVPHHGSRTSSQEAFLRQLQPRWSVVQAGYRNRFGHPAVSVRERYLALGLPLVETARCGAAYWHSERPQQLVCQREHHRRYWHHNGHMP